MPAPTSPRTEADSRSVMRCPACVGRGEAAETRADDDDIEAERGAVAVVERRDFLEGEMCG
jgi:hypothetical protein